MTWGGQDLTASSPMFCMGPPGEVVHAESVQSIAVPAYFGVASVWARLGHAYPTVAMAILNPSSGAGLHPDPQVVQNVRRARMAGVQILGYIHTTYGDRAAAQVLEEVEQYRHWYGVDGIFFDEVSFAENDRSYYAFLQHAVKRANPLAKVVLNPGVEPREGLMSLADIVITFEGDYEKYRTAEKPAKWLERYPPRRIWHLVYGVPTARRMRETVALSKARGAGWIYVTPEALPNPWHTLPAEPYWTVQLHAVR